MAIQIALFCNVRIKIVDENTVLIHPRSKAIRTKLMSEQSWRFKKLDEDITFSKVMNMPAPPTRRNFSKIQNTKLLPVVKQLANDGMLSNSMKVREQLDNDDGQHRISLDGTWQKRGHASHNGIVTAISLDTKKCLDVEVMSDKCQKCLK
jgi:hypothetical protein